MSRRPRSPRAVLLAALVLIGTGAVLLSTAFGSHPTADVAARPQPVDAGARDPGDIRANNSPSLARDPLRPGNLVVANRVDTPAYGCGLHVSFDGGTRWTETRIPIPRGEERKCFAPDVAFAADGTLELVFVTLHGRGNTPHAVWVARSRDGGRTLSAPRRVWGPLAFQVRIAADPADPHRLYLTWVQASQVALYSFPRVGNPVLAVRSDDGGSTWSRPARVSSPARPRVLAPSPAVGPGGTLYVLYLDIGDDRLDYEGAHGGRGGPPWPGRFTLVLSRSRDRGATWQESIVDDRIVPIERFLVFLPPTPSLAVDERTGQIYAAYQDGRLSPSDVLLWSLPPGSGHWRGPVRVNDTQAHDGTSQYLPKVAVAGDGRVDVLYYDRRDDPRNRSTEVSLQSSFDGGKTFTRRVGVTDRAFDSGIGAGSERGLPDLGSRLGLVSQPSEALAVWTDTRAGTVASNKQDIGFARAAYSRPARLSEPARSVLRYGGAVLALAALGLLVARSRGYLRATPTGA